MTDCMQPLRELDDRPWYSGVALVFSLVGLWHVWFGIAAEILPAAHSGYVPRALFACAVTLATICILYMCLIGLPSPEKVRKMQSFVRREPFHTAALLYAAFRRWRVEFEMRHQPLELRPENAIPQVYLVLRVETTGNPDGDDSWYPTEIIRWSTVMLRWDSDPLNHANGTTKPRLEIVDEFDSLVRPTWRPVLSDISARTSSIPQEDIDSAPTFATVMYSVSSWLEHHSVLDPYTGWPQELCTWCTDDPTLRFTIAKQFFLSQIEPPPCLIMRKSGQAVPGALFFQPHVTALWDANPPTDEKRDDMLTTAQQLRLMGLSPWPGSADFGMDRARNNARVILALVKAGAHLRPNWDLVGGRLDQSQCPWMGPKGAVIEDRIQSP